MIRIRGLCLSYDRKTVLRDIDLDIHPGETVALTGRSGSGKTSLARLLLGMIDGRADDERASMRGAVWSGQVLVGDTDVLRASASRVRSLRGRRIGMVAQTMSDALNPHMTVLQHMREVLSLHGVRHAGAAEACLKYRIPEYLHHRYPAGLSGGETQRVLIALALTPRPQYLVLDEPTASLDSETREHIIRLIEEERAARCQLLITHDPRLAERLTDRVKVLEEGRIAEAALRRKGLSGLASCDCRADPAICEFTRTGPGVQVEGLHHSYEKNHVLKDIAFELPGGKCLTIVGKSGSGKSTLARLLTGFAPMQGGQVIWRDGPAILASAPAQFAVLIPQHPHRAMAGHFSVAEVLEEVMSLRPERKPGISKVDIVSGRGFIVPLLSSVGLPTDDDFMTRRTALLSGGEAQRLVIARALAMKARLIVADEPTSALDEQNKAAIIDLLHRVKTEGRALVVLTHDPDVVARLSDVRARLEHGHLYPIP